MVRIYHLKHSDPYLAMTALQRLCVSKPGRVFRVRCERHVHPRRLRVDYASKEAQPALFVCFGHAFANPTTTPPKVVQRSTVGKWARVCEWVALKARGSKESGRGLFHSS